MAQSDSDVCCPSRDDSQTNLVRTVDFGVADGDRVHYKKKRLN